MLFFTKRREEELIKKLVEGIGAKKYLRDESEQRVDEIQCPHCGSFDYKNAGLQASGVKRYKCNKCERGFQAKYKRNPKIGYDTNKGRLISMGEHSNIVKYDSRYILFNGKYRNDPLLQSKKISRINSAMRAVERFAKMNIA